MRTSGIPSVCTGGRENDTEELDEIVVVMAEAPQLAIDVYEYVRHDEADHTIL